MIYSYTIIKDRKKINKKVPVFLQKLFCLRGLTRLGGDDGNRTRVRKSIRMNFYECSLLLTFPRIIGNKHPTMLSSLQYTYGTQALPECVHR